MPGYHHQVPPGQTHLRPYVDARPRDEAEIRAVGLPAWERQTCAKALKRETQAHSGAPLAPPIRRGGCNSDLAQ